MKRRPIFLGVMVTIIILMGVGGSALWRWQYGPVVLKPNAPIDPKRLYSFEVWVEKSPDPFSPPALESAFWQNTLGSFQAQYPNVEFSLVPVEKARLGEAMEKALAQGCPPHILVETAPYFSPWGKLQLAIDPFLSLGERGAYIPGVLANVTVTEGTMAWPCAIMPTLWITNKKVWSRLEDGAAALENSMETAATWVGDGWQSLREGLAKAGFSKPIIALKAGSSSTLVQILIAASNGLIDQEGQLLLTKEMILEVLRQYEIQEKEGFHSPVQGTLLTDFLTGGRRIVGPLGPWVWTLAENARIRGYNQVQIPQDLYFLPPPGGGGIGGYLGGVMGQVAVFRHRRFQGQAHARLSMEFAKSLSDRLGVEMAKGLWGVPVKNATVQEWQYANDLGEKQVGNLLAALGRARGLDPLPGHWQKQRRLLAEVVLEPMLQDYTNRRILASPGMEKGEFAQMMVEAMEDILSLAQGNKGKSRINQ